MQQVILVSMLVLVCQLFWAAEGDPMWKSEENEYENESIDLNGLIIQGMNQFFQDKNRKRDIKIWDYLEILFKNNNIDKDAESIRRRWGGYTIRDPRVTTTLKSNIKNYAAQQRELGKKRTLQRREDEKRKSSKNTQASSAGATAAQSEDTSRAIAAQSDDSFYDDLDAITRLPDASGAIAPQPGANMMSQFPNYQDTSRAIAAQSDDSFYDDLDAITRLPDASGATAPQPGANVMSLFPDCQDYMTSQYQYSDPYYQYDFHSNFQNFYNPPGDGQ